MSLSEFSVLEKLRDMFRKAGVGRGLGLVEERVSIHRRGTLLISLWP